MKKKFIEKIQRWTETANVSFLETFKWRFQALNDKLTLIDERNRTSAQFLGLCIQTALVNRWLNDESLLFDRMEFGYWLNYLGLFGEGAEVGVLKGEFSKVILNSWKGNLLYSIDPWEKFDKECYIDICNVESNEQEKNFLITKKKLKVYGERSKIIRKTSKDGSLGFSDNSLDFVYIDAQHHYEAVVEDISLWYPKVRSGGVICGHDYLDGTIASGDYGVKTAVDEFVKKNDLALIVTRADPFPSWFARKGR